MNNKTATMKYRRELLTWRHVVTCVCGRVTRVMGRWNGPEFQCGRCLGVMTLVHERVRTEEEVDLILANESRWPGVGCRCGAVGKHHVVKRELGGYFLHCRRCGEEIQEVEL